MAALYLSILLLKSWSPHSFYSHLEDGEPDVGINIHNSTSNNDEQSSIESQKTTVWPENLADCSPIPVDGF